MRVWLIVVLSGCGDPLSNSLFYEDAAFASALPSARRLAAPRVLLDSASADAALHVRAIEQAELIAAVFDALALSGETVRTTSPDERSDAYRGWDALPVVREDGVQWWVRADVRQAQGSPASWSIDYSETPDGPWGSFAVGQHESATTGVIAFTLPDGDVLREFTARYGTEATGERNVELSLGLGPVAGDLYWKVVGDGILTWVGLFDVGGRTGLPGIATVKQTLDGGRGDGFTVDDDPVSFSSCWDASGREVFHDEPGLSFGDEAACVLE